MIENLRHFAFSVENIEIAIDFYQELGADLVSTDLEEGHFIEALLGISGVVIKTCKLHFIGGERLELMEFVQPKSVSKEASNKKMITELGLHHVAFTVKDLETTINIVEKYGGFSIGEIIIPTANHSIHAVHAKHIYMFDPFGNLLHLAQDIKKMEN